jgi:hypothetical protein
MSYAHWIQSKFIKTLIMSLPVGTTVVLQAYTSAQCPPCPFDPLYGPGAIGQRYTVNFTYESEVDGIVYTILNLTRVNVNAPGPILEWPELFVKIAFGGGM